MVQTIVCKKDGCSGNEFHIVTEDNKLKLTVRIVEVLIIMM